jgi:hypothetical protein
LRVSTISDTGVIKYCSGLIPILEAAEEQSENTKLLCHTHLRRARYEEKRDIGMEDGPTSENLLEVEAVAGILAYRILLLTAASGDSHPRL